MKKNIANAGEKHAALYVRVSTGHQVDKCSLPFQRKELKTYCEHVLHLPAAACEIYEDAGRSAKNTDRPAFRRMMQNIEAGKVSHVVVYKIDRISRNLVDFSQMYDEFKRRKVTFISLNEQFDTSNALGEAVLKIILVFAELERKMTSERVTDIMIDRAKAAKWNGARVPYGWRWNEAAGMPEHDPVEAPLLVRIYDMYLSTKSTVKITRYLNGHNIPTKRGGKWTSKTVADLIRNPLNVGDYRYNYRASAHGEKKPAEEVVYVRDVFPPIVPRETYEACIKSMDANAASIRKPGMKHTEKRVHIFQGLLVCGSCGRPFQVRSVDKMRKSGLRPTYYICGNRARAYGCDAPYTSDLALGGFIFNYVSNVVKASGLRRSIASPEDLEKILLTGPDFSDIAGISEAGLKAMFSLLSVPDRAAYRPAPLPDGADQGREEELKRDIAAQARALDRLKAAYLYGDGMGEKEFLDMKAAIETRRVKAENELKGLDRDHPTGKAGEAAFVRSASGFLLAHELNRGEHINFQAFAVGVDPAVLNDFLRTVIKKIDVVNGKVDTIHFVNGIDHKFLYRE